MYVLSTYFACVYIWVSVCEKWCFPDGSSQYFCVCGNAYFTPLLNNKSWAQQGSFFGLTPMRTPNRMHSACAASLSNKVSIDRLSPQRT